MRHRFAAAVANRVRARAIACVLGLVTGCGSAPPPAPSPASVASVEASPPPPVIKKIVSVAAGDLHTCAMAQGGSVFCWGRNKDGELGDGGTAGNRTKPLAVPNLRDVEQLAAGHGFSCARLKGGKVRCWGSGKIVGDGRDVDKVRPTEVVGIEGAIDIQAGGFVACAKNQSGGVKCWGTPSVTKGAPVAGADEIAVAGAHACARSLDGKITCWGEGLAKNQKQSGPDVAKATSIATGDSFVCVVVAGQPRCWGRNDQGELGIAPDGETRAKPTTLKGVTGVAKLVSAAARSCALGTDRTVRCWGANNDGELGQGTRSISATAGPVAGLTDVVELVLGAGHACARVGEDGQLHCWGSNRYGQLGDGSLETRTSPVRVVF